MNSSPQYKFPKAHATALLCMCLLPSVLRDSLTMSFFCLFLLQVMVKVLIKLAKSQQKDG